MWGFLLFCVVAFYDNNDFAFWNVRAEMFLQLLQAAGNGGVVNFGYLSGNGCLAAVSAVFSKFAKCFYQS